jgi:predicted metal-dependent phosphoesterase TrpH
MRSNEPGQGDAEVSSLARLASVMDAREWFSIWDAIERDHASAWLASINDAERMELWKMLGALRELRRYLEIWIQGERNGNA